MVGKRIFGKLRSHEAVTEYCLTNNLGMKASILDYGGILRELWVPDQDGTLENVVLSYTTLEDYVQNPAYIGAIIGPTGGRIANGQLKMDDQTFVLPKNDGTNTLHGGIAGFHHKLMTGCVYEDHTAMILELRFKTHDLEGGYPGEVDVQVFYKLMKHENILKLEMKAKTSKRTYLNMTHHSYFNLSGKHDKTIKKHVMELRADRYGPVNKTMLPDQGWKLVKGTAFDFKDGKAIEAALYSAETQIERNKGIDHPFRLIKADQDTETIAAVLWEPISGRKMTVLTNQTHLVVYTGNFLHTAEVASQKHWLQYQGICFEAQEIPNAPNSQLYPCSFLNPGETYSHKLTYIFE